jgi:glyoxylase-like metal-dependent hydrolase (beta-lactamase superfamily II)
VLFDVGSGPNFMASAGKIAEALDAIGVAPDAVTHVLFTHAHPDHIWGVKDDFDEEFSRTPSITCPKPSGTTGSTLKP